MIDNQPSQVHAQRAMCPLALHITLFQSVFPNEELRARPLRACGVLIISYKKNCVQFSCSFEFEHSNPMAISPYDHVMFLVE